MSIIQVDERRVRDTKETLFARKEREGITGEKWRPSPCVVLVGTHILSAQLRSSKKQMRRGTFLALSLITVTSEIQ